MQFKKKVLKNGITVLFEKRELPLVAIAIANRFGASHEPSDIKGIAHFIEHLVFTGTEKRSHEDISREIEKKGGILNAFTAQDVTAFYCKLPSNHLQTGLDILTDIIKHPKFDKQKFEKEKKVIIEEIKMYHDNPQRHVFEQIEANLYGKPFGEGIVGSKETITKMDRDHVANYFKEKYNPKNFIVTVVGNADFNKLCAYFEKTFTPNKASSKPIPIKKQHADTKEERPGIDQSHLVLAMHAPEPTHRDNYVLEVLDAYLANGMSSRLFLTIREEKGLAYTVSSSLTKEKTYAYYSIYVGTTKEAIPEVKKLIIQGFHDVAKKMTEKDLQEAKDQVMGLRRVSEERSTFTMNELLFAEIIGGNAQEFYNYEKYIKSVTLKEVKALATRLIKKYSTAAIVPK